MAGHGNHVLDKGQDPPREEAILGVVQPSEKHRVRVLTVVYATTGIIPSLIMACSENDRSVLNNGVTGNAAFCQTSSTTCYYYQQFK